MLGNLRWPKANEMYNVSIYKIDISYWEKHPSMDTVW